MQTYVDMTTPAGLGRVRCCAPSTSTSTWSAARPGGCGSTTRTSSPSTGSQFGYPEDVAAQAMASCDRVRAGMLEQRAPYDGAAHLPWLAQVRDL